MIKIADSIEIDRPPREVFSFLSDLENAPRWQSGVTESTKSTSGPLGLGTRFKERVHVAWWNMDTICEVTEFVPGRALSFRTTDSGPMSYEGRYALEPEGDDHTRILVSGTTEMKGAWRLIESVFAGEVRKESRAELERLKEALEAAA